MSIAILREVLFFIYGVEGGKMSVGGLEKIDQQAFHSLDQDSDKKTQKIELFAALEKQGISTKDPRIAELSPHDALSTLTQQMSLDEFSEWITPCAGFVKRALSGNMIIPQFYEFKSHLQEIFEQCKSNTGGKVADYIPQLAAVDPEKYAVSVVTVDGQQAHFGDSKDYFSIQSISKPINYCIGLDTNSEEFIHRHVGREPSGHSFNEIKLDEYKRPHNPMINSGAIMVSSMVFPELDVSERFEKVMSVWKNMAAGRAPRFNNAVYQSEKKTADRNFALGYFMRENRCFPDNSKLLDNLDFYFQCCSIENTTEALAASASTLANGGICPISGDRLFSQETTKNCLSLMYSCGMYDYSGEFAFVVGLPAKSGVGGGVMVVVPNVLGMCIWSPMIDKYGNSVRAIEFCKKIVQRFNFHNYDSFKHEQGEKKDPTFNREVEKFDKINYLIWTAFRGDIDGLSRLVASGIDVNQGDYDGRTALHLACSEGHDYIVRYLLSLGADPLVKDRWGATPLKDAKRAKHTKCTRLLEAVAKKNPRSAGVAI